MRAPCPRIGRIAWSSSWAVISWFWNQRTVPSRAMTNVAGKPDTPQRVVTSFDPSWTSG